jgi:polyhydroxybutyrate depolymerase
MAPVADAASEAAIDAPEVALEATVPEASVTKPDVPAAVAAMIAARPYTSTIPSSYTPTRAWPLVVVLHGFGASGVLQSAYLGITPAAERRGFLLASPDGTRTMGAMAQRYWNATDACCDFGRTGVDDVAYITAIIDDMSARYRVDARRIFLIGHSNGGFMAHRMACERSTRIAGIVSLAGAAWNDASRCSPTAPVAVLQVHGTTDATIGYMGGSTPAPVGAQFPSARASVAQWATHNRCDAMLTERTMRFDYVTDVAGRETRVAAHERCAGGAAELWSLEGVGHIPSFSAAWSDAVFTWLMEHPRPE